MSKRYVMLFPDEKLFEAAGVASEKSKKTLSNFIRHAVWEACNKLGLTMRGVEWEFIRGERTDIKNPHLKR